MHVTSRLVNGLAFENEIREFTVLMDGNADVAPSPPELVVGALASCVGIYAASYCQKHGIATEGMVVHADWEKAVNPGRIGKIAISIDLPAGIPEEKFPSFMRTVEQCMVQNTFNYPPAVTMTLNGAVLEVK